MFKSSSGNPYVLCTTSPSNERALHGGEWPFISPAVSLPTTASEQLEHTFKVLGKSKPILAGAASRNGHLVALLQRNGTIILFSLIPGECGGLRPNEEPVFLTKKLCESDISSGSLSPTCLRFRDGIDILDLFAVHVEGTHGRVIRKHIRYPFRSRMSSQTS